MKRQAMIATLALSASFFGQQPARKTPATPQSLPKTAKLPPLEVRQRISKLVMARKPVTITIPIVVTPARLKHQDVMLKLHQQKQTVDTLRMTLVSVPNGAQPPTPPPRKGGGGGMQGAKPRPSMAQQSEIAPASNVGLAQRGSSIHVSPVVNPVPSAAVCHGPTISAVDGQRTGAVFTTDPDHNDNLIVGCGFGSQKGSVYLSGGFATPVRLNVSYWADTWIGVQMDPYLSGELDHFGNVTLVVAPPNMPQVQIAGFSFYAVRARTQLTIFPRKKTNLGFIPDAAGAYTVGLNFFSPPASAPGATLEINRWDQGRFGSASDSFSFSELSPGFYMDTAEFWHFDMTPADCASDFYIDGSWNASWNNAATAINVTTQEQHCHWPPFGESTFYDYSWSHYALAVWVVGPRGANPWAVQQ